MLEFLVLTYIDCRRQGWRQVCELDWLAVVLTIILFGALVLVFLRVYRASAEFREREGWRIRSLSMTAEPNGPNEGPVAATISWLRQTAIYDFRNLDKMVPLSRSGGHADLQITILLLFLSSVVGLLTLSLIVVLTELTNFPPVWMGPVGVAKFIADLISAALITFGAGLIFVFVFGSLGGWTNTARVQSRLLGQAGAWDDKEAVSAASGALMSSGLHAPMLPHDHPLQVLADQMGEALQLKQSVPVGIMRGKNTVNAYAVGVDESDGFILLGEELIERLSPDELAAVLGHELGHIHSKDVGRQLWGEGFQQAIAVWGLIRGVQLVLRWLLFWAGELYLASLSRGREYVADRIGAHLTSKAAMIGALRSLEGKASPPKDPRDAQFAFLDPGPEHPSFSKRIRALMTGASQSSEGEASPPKDPPAAQFAVLNLSATHPPISKRIKALETDRITLRLASEADLQE